MGKKKYSIIGSLGHGIATGLGIGASMEGAKAVINGTSDLNNEQSKQQNNKCDFEIDQFKKCILKNDNCNICCKEYIDLLKSCYKAH